MNSPVKRNENNLVLYIIMSLLYLECVEAALLLCGDQLVVLPHLLSLSEAGGGELHAVAVQTDQPAVVGGAGHGAVADVNFNGLGQFLTR